MQEIEILAQHYSSAQQKLADLVGELNAEMQSVKKARLRAIKNAVVIAKEKRSRLSEAVLEAKALFEKPRTRIMHGIKVGVQKQKGSITYEDEEKVISLIKKHLPEMEEVLVKSEEKLLKRSLETLPAETLQRIGVSSTDAGDEIIIKVVDGDVEKLVDALLKDDDSE